MSYEEILHSFKQARTLKELTHRVDIWQTAVDNDLCTYNKIEYDMLTKALGSEVKALSTLH